MTIPKGKVLLGLSIVFYTTIVMFLTSTVQDRYTIEEMKSVYEEEYCEVVYQYTGDVDSEEFEELTVIAMEYMSERNELQELIDQGLDEYYEQQFEGSNSSDADAYISLFYNLADPINWLFTFIIATFVASFYLAFYAAKLWIQRYFS